MAAPNVAAGNAAADAYGVSAGLDVLSGVFGYLSSLNAQSEANSQADLMRTEAEANAQRYEEQAKQFEAHESVMYSASGVKLAGSPIDALATTAQNAQQNIAAIIMSGDQEASREDMTGTNAALQGRAALVGGLDKGVGMGIDSAIAANGGSGNKDNAGLGAIAELLSTGGGK